MADPRSSGLKLIAERLRVHAVPPPSTHPDADLLTAFAERALSERERAEVLEHLAHCDVCRDVVYLAQLEEQAMAPQAAGSPAPVRWFAWRRLQWAALAASLSMIVAMVVFLSENPRENPERSVLTGREVVQPSPAQPGAPQRVTTGAATYGVSSASENESLDRREAGALRAYESQEKTKANPESALQAGHKGSNENLTFSRDVGALGKLTPGASADDRSKTANFFSDKEAAGRFDRMSNKDQKDAFVSKSDDNYTFFDATPGPRQTQSASDQNGQPLFDLRQQKVQSGPSANMNAQNMGPNMANNRLYVEPNARAASDKPVPAPPPAAPVAMSQSPAPAAGSNFEVSEQTAPAKQAAVGGQLPAAKPAAPTRGVVPAEVARKKKLETIPAHATPQGTEETVAVATHAQDVDGMNRGTGAGVGGVAMGGPIATRSGKLEGTDAVEELPLARRAPATLVQLTPGVAPTNAITGWRIHHGRVQERLYGIWRDVVVGTLERPNAISAAAVPQPHFIAVKAVGNAVWAVEAIGKGQSYLLLYHSADTGITWEPATLTAPEILNPNAAVVIKFTDAQQGEISLSSGERWQTSDGGGHWNLVK